MINIILNFIIYRIGVNNFFFIIFVFGEILIIVGCIKFFLDFKIDLLVRIFFFCKRLNSFNNVINLKV